MKIKFIFVIVCFYLKLGAQSKLDLSNYRIYNLRNNSVSNEISPVVLGDTLYFSYVKERRGKEITKPMEERRDFYHIVSLALDGDIGSPIQDSDVELISSFSNSFHEGPICYCESTGELFVTESNLVDTDRSGIVFKKESVRLKIVVYKRIKNQWIRSYVFPFYDSSYSVGHAAVSRSGDLIYFCSDMPNGFGATDIYMSKRVDGVWQEPINAGAAVNSSGREMFPSLYGDDLLIFSSDSLESGVGGLDLAYSYIEEDRLSVPTALDLLNSDKDDFGLTFHSRGVTGYFSSGRDGGKGGDDIYMIKSYRTPFDLFVVDDLTGDPLVATVEVVNGKVYETGMDGSTVIKQNGILDGVVVSVSADGYLPKDRSITVGEMNEIRLAPAVELRLTMLDLITGKQIVDGEVNLAGEFSSYDAVALEYKLAISNSRYNFELSADGYLDQGYLFESSLLKAGDLVQDTLYMINTLDSYVIYYDVDRSNVESRYYPILDNIVKILSSSSYLRLEIETYCDSRHSVGYNDLLAKRRSNSVADYLKKHGVSEDLLTIKDYGERHLDGDDSKYGEEEYQLNRKTVFRIVYL